MTKNNFSGPKLFCEIVILCSETTVAHLSEKSGRASRYTDHGASTINSKN